MTLSAQVDECRRVRVRGQVQGVGFRPFVHRVAGELGLSGWVRNDAAGVEIEVQGRVAALDLFLLRLEMEAPPLAAIDAVEQAVCAPHAATGFSILASSPGPAATRIAPDTAVCTDCLEELFDPHDRRHRYPFINCTHCGPRYTLCNGVPYDRARTSMATFRQCPQCQAEYDAPADRRFHAQPNACPVCGPQLQLLDGQGAPLRVPDVLAETLLRLERGEIVALKGLGGFHLACNARDAAAVARLRQRKAREEKPFALMVANVASLDGLAQADPSARTRLEAPARPIVLLRKRAGCDVALPGIAPGVAWLGALLPYAPLHYLLFHEAAGRPDGTAWLDVPQPLLLVMTSANPGGEPLVTGNDEAVARLAGIADVFVVHDRDIVQRCDDSVLRAADGVDAPEVFLRRARGFVPQPVVLAGDGPRVLALGAHFKNTVCLLRGREAVVSPHIGELDNRASCLAHEAVVEHLLAVLQFEPERIAHDLHPDFYSTRLAQALARERGIPALAVQHHHAHIGAVLAEHGLDGPVLGLALDGVGLGTDGQPWGGELLRVDGADCRRLGHLRPLPLPGGDRAAREPWRMAAAVLHLLGRGETIVQRFASPAAAGVQVWLEGGRLRAATSSAGRWFDAAAGLLGVCAESRFEGQAAMLLEGLAENGASPEPGDVFLLDDAGGLDPLPLLAQVAAAATPAAGAALFHAGFARALAAWVIRAAHSQGLDRVILGGGCFLNRVLCRQLLPALRDAGLQVFQAAAVPPGDGGLSLGQAWVARKMEV